MPQDYDTAKEMGTAWYRSKEIVPIFNAFVGGGYLSNKKWPLTEASQDIIIMYDSYVLNI